MDFHSNKRKYDQSFPLQVPTDKRKQSPWYLNTMTAGRKNVLSVCSLPLVVKVE